VIGFESSYKSLTAARAASDRILLPQVTVEPVNFRKGCQGASIPPMLAPVSEFIPGVSDVPAFRPAFIR
jgi:hypothetical protein